MTETPAQSPPIVGFEAEFLQRLQDMVSALPKGTADLYIGKHPSHARSLFPYFRITPANPCSAKIQGFVCEGQGIDFTIGEATGGEVFVTSKATEGDKARVEGFLNLCRAVFTTAFSETVVYSRHGRVIRSRIVLKVDGRNTMLGGHKLLLWLFPGRTTKRFEYEPYF